MISMKVSAKRSKRDEWDTGLIFRYGVLLPISSWEMKRKAFPAGFGERAFAYGNAKQIVSVKCSSGVRLCWVPAVISLLLDEIQEKSETKPRECVLEGH